MIKSVQFVFLACLLAIICGCASGTYETRLPPPDEFNTHWMQYKDMPGQKVMVIAVDPTGQWAFGYDANRTTLKEAAESAALKCDKAREKHKVFSRAKLFAINNDIVYHDECFIK
jgi:hypothetical protein